MPDRLLTTTTTLAGCLFHGATYGACLSLLGMPVDALLLGARSMRRIYREYAEDPAGILAHLKSEVRRVVTMIKALFAKGEK